MANLEEFFALFDNPNKVYTIRDLVKFNRDHADLELPPGNYKLDSYLYYEVQSSQIPRPPPPRDP